MSETWLSFHQTILLDQGCDINDTASLRLAQQPRRQKPRADGTVGEDPPACPRTGCLCYCHGLIFNAKHCAGGWPGMQSGKREQGISLRRPKFASNKCRRFFSHGLEPAKAKDSWIRAGIV